MSAKSVYRFPGFPEGQISTVALPELVFTELVPNLTDSDELKVVLVVLWHLSKMRSDAAPWVTREELVTDPTIRRALDGPDAEARLEAALDRAVDHAILLVAPWDNAEGVTEVRYFANSPRGRSSVAAIRRGMSPSRVEVVERPNIFTLYEQNIGPLTALLSEELMEAEQTYPAAWIEEAFREAVRLNKRNWKYILAILERWQAEGRDEIDRRTAARAGKQGDREDDIRKIIGDAYDRLVRH
ncbi:MAG: DnaD domain-containing protein [Anaerolineae bacterium]